MSNLSKRIERIEGQLQPVDAEPMDWRERIRRRMRGEYVPPETHDWRAGKTPEQITAIEAAASRVRQMQDAGATADEVIALIEELCRGQARTG
jgi:hypothetical protein